MADDELAGALEADPLVLRTLELGRMELRAQVRTDNNAVFLADIQPEEAGSTPLRCVYKPVRGEQPLLDFPDQQLAPREVAAYLVDRALGWGFVPPTVLRDGPLGLGSCQLWVESTDAPELFDVLPASDAPPGWKIVATARAIDDAGGEREVVLAHADDERLARLAVFDAVINNSDRKASHLLRDVEETLWAIDHGISFHPDPKLRTVLWGWAGERLPPEIVKALDRLDLALDGELARLLGECLNAVEIEAIRARVAGLLAEKRFPSPVPGWPVLPYPLF